MSSFRQTIYINKFSVSHSDIGKQKGEVVLGRHGEGYIDRRIENIKHSYLYSRMARGFNFGNSRSKKQARHVEGLLRAIHPGLIDEIKAFAEAIGGPYEKIILLTVGSGGNNRGCSHFVKNRYHAHNYDDSPKKPRQPASSLYFT